MAANLPPPDLVIYLQAKPEVLRERSPRKGGPEKQLSREYLEEVVRAYEHFFFRYSASGPAGGQHLGNRFRRPQRRSAAILRRLQEPVKGTQYFLPLGPG